MTEPGPTEPAPVAPTGRPPAPPNDGVHVVVGATGAVGRAVVARLVARGRRVLAVARDGDALGRLAGDARAVGVGLGGLGGLGGVVEVCVADLASDDAVATLAAAVHAPVALALFAAGLPVTGSVETIEPSALAHAAGLKAAGATRLLHGVRDHLVPGSRFVAVAGSLGFEPGPRDAAPGTANAALVNLMRQVARLYGPRGVVVHTLAPGPLDTPRLRAFAEIRAAESGRQPDDVFAEYAARTDLGYLPTPDEIAWLVETLLAPEAAVLHGGVLSPDAGARHSAF
jgi:NAD(P)-dependent dehydrogenase (short-subunit alcohol dehydrogenase family)